MAPKSKASSRTRPAVAFTDDEKKALQAAARAVWDEVGYDVLQMTAEQAGKDINRVTVSRDEVIEVAIDAGRAEDRLRAQAAAAKRRGTPTVVTDEFLKRVAAADYDTLIAAVTPAFPFARYGM